MKLLPFGMPVQMNEETGEIILGEGLHCAGTAKKNFDGIRHLAYDETQAPDDEHCYTFYQNIWRDEDAPLFKAHQITNGITVLMPGLMGLECRKNSGHYHGIIEGKKSTLPEAYEVLCGKAVFLMQESHNFLGEPLQVERLRAFFLEEGEKVIVPPFTAHCVINVGEGPMAFGNLAVPGPLHYEPIGKMHGFAMYLLKVEGQLVFVPNHRYQNLPPLEIARPRECGALGIQFNIPLNTAFLQNPGTFRYLGDPDRYEEELTALYL